MEDGANSLVHEHKVVVNSSHMDFLVRYGYGARSVLAAARKERDAGHRQHEAG